MSLGFQTGKRCRIWTLWALCLRRHCKLLNLTFLYLLWKDWCYLPDICNTYTVLEQRCGSGSALWETSWIRIHLEGCRSEPGGKIAVNLPEGAGNLDLKNSAIFYLNLRFSKKKILWKIIKATQRSTIFYVSFEQKKSFKPILYSLDLDPMETDADPGSGSKLRRMRNHFTAISS